MPMPQSLRGCGASTCERTEAQLDQGRGNVPGQGRENREILLSARGWSRCVSHLMSENFRGGMRVFFSVWRTMNEEKTCLNRKNKHLPRSLLAPFCQKWFRSQTTCFLATSGSERNSRNEIGA